MKTKTPQNRKRPNIDHFAHQVGVSGVGAHKNKKKSLPRKTKHKKNLRESAWKPYIFSSSVERVKIKFCFVSAYISLTKKIKKLLKTYWHLLKTML